MTTRNEPLVTIADFPTSFEASLVRGMLETSGIPAFVPGEAEGSFGRHRGGISATVVQVFESDKERAMAVLRRSQMRIVERRHN